MAPALVPLPVQPAGVPWPAKEWPLGNLPAGVDASALNELLDTTFAEPQPETTTKTNALLIVQSGRLVAERYAAGHGPANPQPSWSMAKSMLHAAVGVLVRDRQLDVSQPANVPQWREQGDQRAKITIDQLLHMTSGLRFREDYVDETVSDVIQMLFRPGAPDTGAFAACFPLEHEPDTVFNYSSGATNIVSAIVRDIVGGRDRYLAFLREELFDRIGMATAQPKFDDSGSWIASSFCFATPRDFARFGLLYLRDGMWENKRILPERWVDYARTPAPHQPEEPDRGYGAHWWLMSGDDTGTFYASGYEGQQVLVSPGRDLIIVRCGQTPVERRLHLVALYRRIIDLFRGAAQPG